MLHYSALVLAFVVAVRTIPVDEIFARNGIDGQAGGSSVFAAASNCTGSPVDCSMREFSGTSLLKIASENAEDRGGALVEPTSLSTSLEGGDVPGSSGISGPGGKT